MNFLACGVHAELYVGHGLVLSSSPTPRTTRLPLTHGPRLWVLAPSYLIICREIKEELKLAPEVRWGRFSGH